MREGDALKGPDSTAPGIHVAGNSVVDVLLRDVPAGMGAVDGWSRGNVHFLSHSPECVLGGNGGSVAYVLGRLGERVTLNTRIGEDAFGAMVKDWLERAGVALIGAPAAHTAVNVISLSPEGTRRSIYYTGDRVDWGRSMETEAGGWFYASGYGRVTAEDLGELVNVFRRFRAMGTRVAFDPGPWFLASVIQEEMAAAWREVDCLIGTAEELSTWHPYDRVDELIVGLLDAGPRQVVVKRGGEGAAFGGQAEGVGALGTDRVAGVNTVGAGDTFNAGLLHGLNRGESLEASVAFGMRLATEAVRRGRGALGALLTD